MAQARWFGGSFSGIALCIALACVSCQYASHPADGTQACAVGPGKQCPDGYHCAGDMKCWRNGHDPVDGAVDTAADQKSDRPAVADTRGDVIDDSRPDAPPDLPADAGSDADARSTVVEGGVDAVADGRADSGPATCPTGQHNCGTCVDDSSPLHCGAQCQPCTAPTGGTAVCAAGNVCDFTCGTLKKCNGACISGCCGDADCPMQSDGKVGTCDTATHTCSYACAATQKSCNGKCIAKTACCTRADCPGACQTCSAAGTCDKVVSADDTDKTLCPGTCDATGACKSKRGQSCTTVAAGCVTGSTCSPDGFCCDRACTGPCEACDLTTAPGTCTAVTGAAHVGHASCAGGGTTCAGTCTGRTDGACTYPTGACGAPVCSGLTYRAAGSCSGGSCQAGASEVCSFVCTTSGCTGSCVPDSKRCDTATGVPQTCTAAGVWQNNPACAAGFACVGGSCTCSKSVCGTACVDTQTDPSNCGTCGIACGATQTCVAGACKIKDGQPCSVGSQCVSGTCNIFYRDDDGDGYGGPADGYCTITTAPAGHVAVAGDCCDNGGNLTVANLIHPNAGFQNVSAGGVCNVTWDYNCSGTVEKGDQFLMSCSPFPNCEETYIDYPDTKCGMLVATQSCSPTSVGCVTGSGAGHPLLCR